MTKKVLSWIGTVFFALSAVIMGGLSAPFFALLSINMLPIEAWQKFKKEKLKVGKALSIILGFVLFFIGVGLVQTDDENESSTTDRSTSVVETVDDSTTESETTESIENTTLNTITTTIATTTITIEATTTTGLPENSTFSIQYIDVGQADAALVECDGKYMLIDGGNAGDSSKIYSILKNKNIETLELVIATHAHEDHIGGLSGALNYAKSNFTLCPVISYDSDIFADFKKYADANGGGITVPKVNDTYALGSAEIKILGVNSSSDTNNTSIILMIKYGDTKFLFTGDAEREAEQVILNSGADLSCDVLKVGHHGSDTSTSYVWLNAILPEYAVISVGKENSYGHPTDAVLSRLRDADVKTYRTDLNGDIYATSDGKIVTITSNKTASDDDIFKEGQIPTEPPTQASTQKTTEAPVVDEPISNSYVVNKNPSSMKFHHTWCNSADKIKSSNRWDYTGTRDELIAKGYSPCKNCNP